MPTEPNPLPWTDRFERRHVGVAGDDLAAMLSAVGLPDLEAVAEAAVPESIRLRRPLAVAPSLSEHRVLAELREMASRNRVLRSFLGMGYHDTITPGVILRNVLENPGWYTQYTPYQSEISQGRLEALLNYQTMVSDLTGLPVANASLLDEATAAAEAMAMMIRVGAGESRGRFLVDDGCHPQTIEVVASRAEPLGVTVEVLRPSAMTFDASVAGALLQFPATDGALADPTPVIERAHAAGALVAVACDLLALTLVTSPGALGADVALGSSQRFGVPLGYGGPHAAFFATREEHVRQLPGRLIGVSRDARGQRALRMALGTREQHIRREKATSNICTAQVLLAVVASFYAAYHGPDGLRAIAERVHRMARMLARGVKAEGHAVAHDAFFDTVRVELSGDTADAVLARALGEGMNLRRLGERAVGVALDETAGQDDLEALLRVFAGPRPPKSTVPGLAAAENGAYRGPLARPGAFLHHPVFNEHRSETEMLRYIRRLESRDLSLTTSMIPLGSCTMKLNATVEMLPVTWPEFGRLHPFAPPEQARGYASLFAALSAQLAEITGLPAVSLQPNSGAQGEYAGLLVIRAYHRSRGGAARDVCLIPSSAHGTNPASAAMAGLRVVVLKCDESGNVDLADLRTKAQAHAATLAALMVTYPSTHGVFEEAIRDICSIVHDAGGQVYLDGANLNAQVGLCRPGDYGADVCHVNLHKTFCIPHGGGGPGMGPICVAPHLAPFLPGHPVIRTGGTSAIGAISAAPWGSASILPISWAYVRALGPDGLRRATETAILSANYVARRLEGRFPVLYRGAKGFVAHECILDLRPLEKRSGITAEDVAKRLMDYGFHAPTLSFPVAGTLMVEPTESESRAEIDRFCDALIAIHAEAEDVASGRADRRDNLLKNAPHPASVVTATEWARPYSRERAAFPAPWTREHKFWPAVARVDNPWGDRNLTCSCPPPEPAS